MKRLYFLSILFVMAVISASSQVNSVFDRFSDTKEVTSVYISKVMLRMIPDVDANGLNVGDISSKLDCIRVLSTSNSKMISTISSDFQNEIKKGKYEILLQTNDDGEKVVIYMKSGNDGINEYLIAAEEPNEFNYVLIAGSITPADVMKMNEKKSLSRKE